MYHQNLKFKKQKSFYEQYQQYYKLKIRDLLKKFDMELVVYDETEYFRQHHHSLFMYPYIDRKTMV